ncbi:unnamed protein product [Schistocephalus solidus]|uniref:Reverse transcriptase domain-containing protein n=1 Tax=Schistocephalus solidus TaxID=70667 RepID=A0A183T8Q3_SCHSO|nr:unnamed protein product [Schistocephalus solidus]
MGTMSMTLRSKSADRRQFSGSLGYEADSSLLHGILGSSRFLEQSHLKRAHSTFVPSAVAMAQSTGAMATSGYSTMGGSSSGGAPAQSNEAANGDDDDDNASLDGHDMTASRFTTGSGQIMSGSSFEEKSAQMISRSTADLPFTSASYFGWELGVGGNGEQTGQATVAVVTSAMSGIIRTHEGGGSDHTVPQAGDKIEGPPGPAASVPPAVLAASPRATSVGPISKEGSDNQYSERAPPKPLRTPTNLTRRQTLAGREIEIQKQTNKVTTSQADQAMVSGDSRMTADSYIDSTEAYCSEIDSSSTTVATKSYGTSANTNESYLHPQDSNEMDSKQTYKQLDSVHHLKHAFSVDIRRSSLSTTADLAKVCLCQSASTQTIQVDSTSPSERARDQHRGNQLPGSPNPGPSTRSYRNGSGGINTPTTPAAPPPVDQTSIFEADGVTQIVGIDQWSSSGTESTTGVILRSGGNGTNAKDEEEQRTTGRSWSPLRPANSRDPMKKLVAKINATLASLQSNGAISKAERLTIKPTDLAMARFYGLPKVHKHGAPLRHIISLRGTPTFNLAKWLFRCLNCLTSDSDTTVRSAAHFLERLRGLHLKADEVMISFDVTSLFTSIPQSLAIETVGGPSEADEPPADGAQTPLHSSSSAHGAHHHPHHAPGCPRRDRKPEQTEEVTVGEQMHGTIAVDPLRTTPSHRQYQQPLPVLPVDTLPVRPSHVREGEMHLQSYAYGFSRSIPAGVHLAGLSEPPPGETQRMLPQYWVGSSYPPPTSKSFN